jgi:hypothetical protein
MKGIKVIGYLCYWLLAGYAVAALAGSYGCASIGSPTGGPRDTIAPVLVGMSPENFTPNFKYKTITLNFDEYVDLDNVFDKLIINPPLNKFPQVDRKLRTVTIKIKDTLEANTTYSWRFDEVIKDVNEGNPLGDFTYVFSTGPTFDSASFAGRVLSAETGKVDSTLLVVLHNNLADTAIQKNKPRYVTKLDGKGFFRFAYLAPGTYNVFAIKDDGMKRYSDTTAPFAFSDAPIEVSYNTEPVEMLFFRAAEEKREEGTAAPKATTRKKPEEDEAEEKKKKTLTVRPVLGTTGSHDILEDLVLEFSSPLENFDSARIIFTDTTMKPVGKYAIERDTVANRLLVKHAWKMESWYQLIFTQGAATDSTGISFSKNDTLIFKTKGTKDYGSVKLTLAGLDFGSYPALQWLQSGKVVKSIPLGGRTYYERLFLPGEYEINILYDSNQNGKWDTGNYRLKKQPERVIDIPRKITVRGSWENEFNIDINAANEEEK